jgi:four helix bundle protein
MLRCERFKAWEFADHLAHTVYDSTRKWPADERFGLISQARRAAFSVPANICEGASKRGRAEFGRYLDIAIGSLAELTYTLHFARKRGWINADDWAELELLRSNASRMLWLLYRSVRLDSAPRAARDRP